MFLFAQAVNLRITATIVNNLVYSFTLIQDCLVKGSKDGHPKSTIEGFDATDANAGKYHGQGGTEGVVGYMIPHTDKSLIVYFGNVGIVGNPVVYVYATKASSIEKWDDLFVHRIKEAEQTSIIENTNINGTDYVIHVSTYRHFFGWRGCKQSNAAVPSVRSKHRAHQERGDGHHHRQRCCLRVFHAYGR
jgi:hypothetical protein